MHIMPHNSRRCVPISIILSLLHSPMKCRKSLNKISRLTSNLLPHYLVKLECLTEQLYSTLFNANVMQNRLFTIYTCMSAGDANFLFAMSIHTLIYSVTARVKIVSAVRTQARHWPMDSSVMCCQA